MGLAKEVAKKHAQFVSTLVFQDGDEKAEFNEWLEQPKQKEIKAIMADLQNRILAYLAQSYYPSLVTPAITETLKRPSEDSEEAIKKPRTEEEPEVVDQDDSKRSSPTEGDEEGDSKKPRIMEGE